MNLFTKQKDSQTQKTDLGLPEEKGGEEGINQVLTDIHHYIENK